MNIILKNNEKIDLILDYYNYIEKELVLNNNSKIDVDIKIEENKSILLTKMNEIDIKMCNMQVLINNQEILINSLQNNINSLQSNVVS